MIKKIFRYVIILLLLLLGLCAIGLLFLFFVPNSSIFGITYIGKKTEFVTQGYDLSKVSSIEVNSNSYNVKVVNGTNEDKISVYVYSDTFGYVLKKNSKVNLTTKLYSSKLTFNLTEPHGFAYKNNSYVEIRLPKTKDTQSLNLTLNNNSAKTDVNCKNSNINNLTYKTSSGDLNLNEGNLVGNINLTLNRGDCYFNSGINLNNNNLTLSQTYGDLQTAEGKVLGNVTHTSNTTGKVSIETCAKYTANFGTAGGQIYLGKTTDEVNITSTDTHVTINEAVSTVNINLTNTGSATINTLSDNGNANASTIRTANGNIKIDTSKKFLMLRSTNGNVEISKMYVAVDVVTESGNITVSYPNGENGADEFDYTSTTPPYPRKADIKTKSGNVNISGVENLNLTISGNGDATVVFKEVYGKNVITGATGNIKITTPSNGNPEVEAENLHKYYLNASATNSGKVSINITGFMPVENYTNWANVVGYLSPKPQPADVPHWLTATVTSGNLSVENPNL